MAKYCVVNTDLMSGVKQPADLVSLRFYEMDEDEAVAVEVENGVIAKLGDLENREVFAAVAATAADDPNECVVIANPELMYDERKRVLEDYINPAGKAIRGYRIKNKNIMSWTAEGFVGGTAPEKGGAVGIGVGGKLDAAGTGLGKCIDIWKAGKRTFYAIQFTKVVPAAEDTE